MNTLFNSKKSLITGPNDQQVSQFSESGLYVKEDDQDWGSAGMNNIQSDSE